MRVHKQTIAACVVTAMVVGGGTASAAKLITGNDIADGSIKARDIARDGITHSRLSASVRFLLSKEGRAGRDGATGPVGPEA